MDVETVTFSGDGSSVTLEHADTSVDNSEFYYRSTEGGLSNSWYDHLLSNNIFEGSNVDDNIQYHIVVNGDVEYWLYDNRETFNGSSGNDLIHGGNDADTIHGEAGNDKLSGDNGNDSITGGSGSDEIGGGDGSDVLFGDGGADTVEGGSGQDTIWGGPGTDLLTGGSGADQLHGGDGSDLMGGGGDLMHGDSGSDRLYGDDGNDTLNGGLSDDRLYGGADHDVLNGDWGNDLLAGGSGNDVLDGGQGMDLLYGQEGEDSLTGGADDDVLFGGDHNDTLEGGAGADFLEGGHGHDVLNGGDGVMDVIGYTESNAGVTIDLGAGTATGGHAAGDTFSGIEGVLGTDHDDSLTGDSGNNFLYGEGGNDTLSGDAGRDLLSGGEGDDNLNGGTGADTLYGGDGDDTLNAGSGEGTGQQLLEGGEGNDIYQIFAHGGDHFVFEEDVPVVPLDLTETMRGHITASSSSARAFSNAGNVIDGVNSSDNWLLVRNDGMDWVELDLQGEASVSAVHITVPTNTAANDLNGAYVVLLDGNGTEVHRFDPFSDLSQAGVIELELTEFTDARYVRLEHPSDRIRVSEIQVFGTQDYYDGSDGGVNTDQVVFEDLNLSAMTITQDNDNLVLTWGTGSTSFNELGANIEEFVFADGSTYTTDQILDLL